MERSIGFPLAEHESVLISNFVNQIIGKKIDLFMKKCTSIESFFNNIKKGSKLYRNIIVFDKTKTAANDHLLANRLEKAQGSLGGRLLSAENFMSKAFYRTWSRSFIPHKDKEIFLKYTHNRLIFNDQLSKFEPNVT